MRMVISLCLYVISKGSVLEILVVYEIDITFAEEI